MKYGMSCYQRSSKPCAHTDTTSQQVCPNTLLRARSDARCTMPKDSLTIALVPQGNSWERTVCASTLSVH
eukprot:4645042-Amphidinium_carterae.1